MTTENIRNAIIKIALQYPIKRVTLFGSRATGTNRSDSDIDLIMEFSEAVSLLELSEIRMNLEDIFGVPVDIIHGPLKENDLLEVEREIEIYAA